MKKYLFIISLLLLFPLTVDADAKIDVSSSKTNTKDTITVHVDISSTDPIGYYEYTLDYDQEKLKLTDGNDYNVNRPNNSNTKKINKTFKFKILKQGTSKITVKAYSVMNLSNKDMKVTVNPATITTSSNNNNSNSASTTPNYLSELKVEGYEISPKFDKETTDYKLTIDKNIEEINIIAKALDKNSTIEGNGTIKVEPGENNLQISVRNQNGEKTIYNLLLTINEDSATSEKELKFKEITITLKTAKNIPENYSKYTTVINEKEVECYKSNINSDYCLIYGVNENTKEEGWYSYNLIENTIQKYNQEIEKYYEQKIEDTQILIYILGGISLFFGITVIVLAIKLNNKKRKIY